jgi:pSer/pThr/pTyr-binding forkhead associated (FHA) protein
VAALGDVHGDTEVTSEIVWLVGRYAFLGLLYLFVLLVLRALVAEMRAEAPSAWPARYMEAAQPGGDPAQTGQLAPPAEAEPALEPAAPPASDAAPQPLRPAALPPRLIVVESGQPADVPIGTAFSLTAVTTIGRGPHNSIALPSDSYASTNHALVFVREGALYLRDRGSTNGTTVNESRAEGEVLLHDGDRIMVGTTVLRYSAGQTPAQVAPLDSAPQ